MYFVTSSQEYLIPYQLNLKHSYPSTVKRLQCKTSVHAPAQPIELYQSPFSPAKQKEQLVTHSGTNPVDSAPVRDKESNRHDTFAIPLYDTYITLPR